MKALTERFIDRYLPRGEIAYRLPVRTPIAEVWPHIFAERKARSVSLPLRDQQGNAFWYVINRTVEEQANAVAETARRELAFGILEEADDGDAMIDEAVWSSVIEGAFTSRAEAARLIRRDKAPANRSEQMVKNNYRALMYVLEHLEEPITKRTLVDIAHILTRDASEETVTDYRTGPVYVTDTERVVYTPPAAEKVNGMMESLLAFIESPDTHPVLKACIAHFYLVYVHPFTDGNGRTARALSYMILLRSGYDFFRYFSISGIIAKERGRYYRSMLWVEDPENGGNDMTYFIDHYTDMLSRAVRQMETRITRSVVADRVEKRMKEARVFNDRQIGGIAWLLRGEHDRVTVEQWKKHFRTATETARKDLMLLAEKGLLERTAEGRKAVFMLPGAWDEVLAAADAL